MLVSDEYRNVLRATHEQQPWGVKGHRHIDAFMPFYEKLGCTSLVDYGSGTEALRQALAPSIDVRCYDPGVIGRDALPEPADFVVCTDVLEHIEPEYLDNVLNHIRDLALKGAYLNIATNLAKRVLADGRNAHLIVKPAQWWLDRLRTIKGWNIVKYELGQKRAKVWLNR